MCIKKFLLSFCILCLVIITPVSSFAKPFHEKYPMQQEFYSLDEKKGLSHDTNAIINSKSSFVMELDSGTALSDSHDGLYIYTVLTGGCGVPDNDHKFYIRRNDRVKDKGLFLTGSANYHYLGNPINPATGRPEFVRHSQLVQGCFEVWAAGILEIFKGKIVYVTNGSGHFKPKPKSLENVSNLLKKWGLHANHITIYRRYDTPIKSETKQKIKKNIERHNNGKLCKPVDNPLI